MKWPWKYWWFDFQTNKLVSIIRIKWNVYTISTKFNVSDLTKIASGISIPMSCKGLDHNFTMFFPPKFFKIAQTPTPSSILNEKPYFCGKRYWNCYTCFSILNGLKNLVWKKTLWNCDPIPKGLFYDIFWQFIWWCHLKEIIYIKQYSASVVKHIISAY